MLIFVDMPQSKNHGKTAERKRAEIRELELQMAKKFLCGACHIGFEDQQVGCNRLILEHHDRFTEFFLKKDLLTS